MPTWGNRNRRSDAVIDNELASLKRVVADMEWERRPKQTPQGGGRGGKATGKGTRGHAADELCGCCGRTGHAKSSCHHKAKACNTCGLIGHMSQVCRCPVQHVKGGNPSQQQRQQTQQQQKPQINRADHAPEEPMEDPWVCPVCLAMNLMKSQKCKMGFCHGKRPHPEKVPPTDVVGKSFIKLQLRQHTVELDDDAEMNEEDTEKEIQMKTLQNFITAGKAMGLCVQEASTKLAELSPKLVTMMDRTKTVKEASADKLRLLKNQEMSTEKLTTKIATCKATIITVQEQQITLLAEALERHTKSVEAIKRDCARLTEKAQSETAEAEIKLCQINEQYAADFKMLDSLMTVPAVTEPVHPQVSAVTTPPPAAVPILPEIPTITMGNMQALMGPTGSNGVTAEQTALLASVMPMLNAMIASAMRPPQVPIEEPPQPADTVEERAARLKAVEEAEEERRLAEEAKILNGGGSPGKQDKANHRVNPMA
jgi:hypothetical protein